jgi:hypothetical protein
MSSSERPPDRLAGRTTRSAHGHTGTRGRCGSGTAEYWARHGVEEQRRGAADRQRTGSGCTRAPG